MTPSIIKHVMERRKTLKITFHYPDRDAVAYAKDAEQLKTWKAQANASGLQFSC